MAAKSIEKEESERKSDTVYRLISDMIPEPQVFIKLLSDNCVILNGPVFAALYPEIDKEFPQPRDIDIYTTNAASLSEFLGRHGYTEKRLNDRKHIMTKNTIITKISTFSPSEKDQKTFSRVNILDIDPLYPGGVGGFFRDMLTKMYALVCYNGTEVRGYTEPTARKVINVAFDFSNGAGIDPDVMAWQRFSNLLAENDYIYT